MLRKKDEEKLRCILAPSAVCLLCTLAATLVAAPRNRGRRIHPKKQWQVNKGFVQATVGHGCFVYVSTQQANSATCQAVLCPAQQTTNQHTISMQPPCEQAPTSMACASGAMSSE